MESRTCRGIIVHVLSRLPGVGLVDQNGDAIHNNYIICLLFALMFVCLFVCWSLTSLCHSNGHIETMPARALLP